MVMVEKVDFIDVEYGNSLSLEVFAIAKVYLHNNSIIEGILLYYPWSYNEREDYLKVESLSDFEELFNGRFGVKFPENVYLSSDSKVGIRNEIIKNYYEYKLDKEIENYTQSEWDNVSAMWNVGLLKRYSSNINWKIACEKNKNLTSELLNECLDNIDFNYLSRNENLVLPIEFMEEHFDKFSWSKIGKCQIRSMDFNFLIKYKKEINISQTVYDFQLGLQSNFSEEELKQVCELYNLQYIEPF